MKKNYLKKIGFLMFPFLGLYNGAYAQKQSLVSSSTINNKAENAGAENYFVVGNCVDVESIKNGDHVVLQNIFINTNGDRSQQGFIKKSNEENFVYEQQGLYLETNSHLVSTFSKDCVFKVIKNNDNTVCFQLANTTDPTYIKANQENIGHLTTTTNQNDAKFTLEWDSNNSAWKIKSGNGKFIGGGTTQAHVSGYPTFDNTAKPYNIIKVQEEAPKNLVDAWYYMSIIASGNGNLRTMTAAEDGIVNMSGLEEAKPQDNNKVWTLKGNSDRTYSLMSYDQKYINEVSKPNSPQARFKWGEEAGDKQTLKFTIDRNNTGSIWNDVFRTITITRTDATDNWSLNLEGDKTTLHEWSNPNEGSHTAQWTTVPAAKLNETNGYALGTFCSPAQTELPTGVSAYIATSKDNQKIILKKIADGDSEEANGKVLPKNTPVILRAEKAGFYPMLPKGGATVTIPNDTKNLLVGTGRQRILTPSAGCYGLGKPNGKDAAAMCTYNGETIAPFKAYLPKEEGSTVQYRSIEFDGEGGTTGIEDINSSIQDDPQAPIYTLQGIQVEKPLQKGIYIQNGKKFIVK